MALIISPPREGYSSSAHHATAAVRNLDVATQAIGALQSALDGTDDVQRILLKAAAGAGKSFALRKMVVEALDHPSCSRVGITAFTNKQVIHLAADLGQRLGKEKVCLRVSKDRAGDVPDNVHQEATVAFADKDVPPEAEVLLATTHMMQFGASRLRDATGPATNGSSLFDVLFVDEAWMLAEHRYARIRYLAPLIVGVGDVGQLPPLDSSRNPWRGDPGHNPYRAWPTRYDRDDKTWARQLPAVWRPTAEQLPLWRAFYGDWADLTCVAAPGDRRIEVSGLEGDSALLWDQVGSGVPTIVEVDGLVESEAPDIDRPLLGVVEAYLDDLLSAEVVVRRTRYDAHGLPEEVAEGRPDGAEEPVIAVLATRNAAVDDAHDMVDRLSRKHGLPDRWMVASTVDSWQGQTNTLTVALHPLSGASGLDTFNSAFGRLAVTCTRATHGLVLFARGGLDELLATAPVLSGTPLGEPGSRELPRQTHQRILSTFARCAVDVGDLQ